MPSWSPKGNSFWRQAPLFRPLIFLMLGIYACDQAWLGQHPLGLVSLVLVLSGLCLFACAFYRGYSAWPQVLFLPGLALFFFSAGAGLYATSTAFPIPEKQTAWQDTGKACLVRILEEPRQRPQSIRLHVARLCCISEGKSSAMQGEALVYVYPPAKPSDFAEGDSLLLPNAWQAIRNSGNPFEMDYARFQQRRGIRAQRFLAPEAIRTIGRQSPAQQGWLQTANRWCTRQLRTYIRDEAAFGLLQAMLLGDESDFDAPLRQAYAQTGVIHIVSISGSHVAALYLMVVSLLFWAKGRRGLWLKACLSILLVWVYVLLAGAPPTALRAALMFSVLSLGLLGSRESHPLNILAAAALCLLVIQPAWMFAVGFQLSFGAVLSMMLFYAPLYRLWQGAGRHLLTQKLGQALAASLAAEILTAPLVIYYFHNFPLLFLPANILAMVLVGFCALAGGLLVLALAWWPAAALVTGALVSGLVRVFNKCILWMQGLNLEALQNLYISLAELVLLYLLIAVAGAWWLRKWRHGPVVSLALGCALLVSLNFQNLEALQQQRIIVFNAGKRASASYVQGKTHRILSPSLQAYSGSSAHIGYRAWHQQAKATRNCYVLQGRKILYLRDSILEAVVQGFPFEIVIVENPVWQLRPQAVIQTFHPKRIVLAGRPGPKTRQQWKHHCQTQGVALHITSEEGAWVLK